MNLTDLGAELKARAAAVPATTAASRLEGVRTRVRIRRRRQVGLTVALAGVGVAMVGLAPVVTGLRADRVPSPASSTTAKVHDPLVFDDLRAGDPLITSTVGNRGQSDLVVKFTPQDTNLYISAFCSVANDTDSDLWGQVTINGHKWMGTGCSSSATANSNSGDFGDTPQARRDALAESGVLPGEQSVLRIRLQTEKGAPRADPSVRLGVALYQLSGPRVISDGITIPRLAETDAHDYRLVAYRTARITKTTRRLSLDVSSSRSASWVSAGNPDDGPNNLDETDTLLVNGVGQNENSSGGTAGLELKPGTKTLELRVGAHSTGTMMIAYYEQID